MWKIILVLCVLSFPALAMISPCVGITCLAAQFGGAGITSATAITWSNAEMITWGDGTIIVEN